MFTMKDEVKKLNKNKARRKLLPDQAEPCVGFSTLKILEIQREIVLAVLCITVQTFLFGSCKNVEANGVKQNAQKLYFQFQMK